MGVIGACGRRRASKIGSDYDGREHQTDTDRADWESVVAVFLMPTINARGQVIQELDETDADFVARVSVLRKLNYPRDLEIIRHLCYIDFKNWLYGLDPKLALFLTNERKFSSIQQAMREKTWLHDLYDSAWRLLNGFDF